MTQAPHSTSFVPTPELRSRVAAIQVIVSDGNPVRVLPSSSAVLGLQFSGRVFAEDGPLSIAGVTGLQRGPRHFTYQPRTASVLVRFTPLGAACLGTRSDELTGRSVPLDEVLSPRLVRETTERLGEASDDAARVQVVERLLRSLPFEPDPLVAHALERVEHESIARLARSLGVSERQLERRFQAQVGLSPRAFATLKRFERALELARRGHSLTEVAHEAGYFDQPHFNRDFRRFTGLSPRALFAHDVGNVQVPSDASRHGVSHENSRPVRERAQGPSPGPLRDHRRAGP